MRIAIAADHAGLSLKQPLADALRKAGHDVVDLGANEFNAGDDYPDYVLPLARAVAKGEVTRGIAVCGSGVGATVAANKVITLVATPKDALDEVQARIQWRFDRVARRWDAVRDERIKEWNSYDAK